MTPGTMAKAVRMHDERDAAIRTLDRAAALPAEHRRRQAASIEEDQRLLSGFEPRRNGVLQRPTQNHIGTMLGVFLAHVDDRDRCERAILHAPLHHQTRVS